MNRRALPYAGFAPLRKGRIHMYCPACGRRQSNMPRVSHDPPSAVVIHVLCEKAECSGGVKDDGPEYLDACGRWLTLIED